MKSTVAFYCETSKYFSTTNSHKQNEFSQKITVARCDFLLGQETGQLHVASALAQSLLKCGDRQVLDRRTAKNRICLRRSLTLTTSFLERTYKHFEKVTDPRINRGENHSLIEMIFVTLCATICGADTWADVERYGTAKLDWLRKYVKLEFGVPSHDTFGRVFSRLDSIEFYAALQSWTNEIAGCLKGDQYYRNNLPITRDRRSA